MKPTKQEPTKLKERINNRNQSVLTAHEISKKRKPIKLGVTFIGNKAPSRRDKWRAEVAERKAKFSHHP